MVFESKYDKKRCFTIKKWQKIANFRQIVGKFDLFSKIHGPKKRAHHVKVLRTHPFWDPKGSPLLGNFWAYILIIHVLKYQFFIMRHFFSMALCNFSPKYWNLGVFGQNWWFFDEKWAKFWRFLQFLTEKTQDWKFQNFDMS